MATANILLLDGDAPDACARIASRIDSLARLGVVDRAVRFPSKTKGHYYFVVRLTGDLGVGERIALQAALGSARCWPP